MASTEARCVKGSLRGVFEVYSDGVLRAYGERDAEDSDLGHGFCVASEGLHPYLCDDELPAMVAVDTPLDGEDVRQWAMLTTVGRMLIFTTTRNAATGGVATKRAASIDGPSTVQSIAWCGMSHILVTTRDERVCVVNFNRCTNRVLLQHIFRRVRITSASRTASHSMSFEMRRIDAPDTYVRVSSHYSDGVARAFQFSRTTPDSPPTDHVSLGPVADLIHE